MKDVALLPIFRIDFRDLSKGESEGLVFFGCNGSLDEWKEGLIRIFRKKIDFDLEKSCEDPVYLKTIGGRIDLVFKFKNSSSYPSLDRLFRIQFLEFTLISDYIVTYANHY